MDTPLCLDANGGTSFGLLDLDIMRMSAQNEQQMIQPVKSWIERWFPHHQIKPRSLLVVIETGEVAGSFTVANGLCSYLAWVANAGHYAYFMQDSTKLSHELSSSKIGQLLHDFQRHPTLGLLCIHDTLDCLLTPPGQEPLQEFPIPFNLLKVIRA